MLGDVLSNHEENGRIVLRSIDWYCILAMAIGTVNIYNGSLLLRADVVKAKILLSSSSAEVNNISLSLGSGS